MGGQASPCPPQLQLNIKDGFGVQDLAINATHPRHKRSGTAPQNLQQGKQMEQLFLQCPINQHWMAKIFSRRLAEASFAGKVFKQK
jgi:hypothetical protein